MTVLSDVWEWDTVLVPPSQASYCSQSQHPSTYGTSNMKRRRNCVANADPLLKKKRLTSTSTPPPRKLIKSGPKRPRSPLRTFKPPTLLKSSSLNCHICHRLGTASNRLISCQDCGGSCCPVCQRICLRERGIPPIHADFNNDSSGKLDDLEGCERIICKNCSVTDDDRGVICVRCARNDDDNVIHSMGEAPDCLTYLHTD